MLSFNPKHQKSRITFWERKQKGHRFQNKVKDGIQRCDSDQQWLSDSHIQAVYCQVIAVLLCGLGSVLYRRKAKNRSADFILVQTAIIAHIKRFQGMIDTHTASEIVTAGQNL